MTLCGEKRKVTGFKIISALKKQQAATMACTPCWMSEAAVSFSILSRWLTGENDCYQPSLSSVNRTLGGLLHQSAALTK